MRNKVSNSLWGLIFILAGVAFLGNAYDWWGGFNLFFDGWWTLFIIIPCAISIIRHGFNAGSIIGLGIGIILLLSSFNNVCLEFFDNSITLYFILLILT